MAPRTIPPEIRFRAKIDLNGPVPPERPDLGPCHLWTKACFSKGYGAFGLARGKMVLAHRYAWELEKGPIPAGMQIDHLCFVRRCVNVGHMRLTTNKENNEHLKGSRKGAVSQYRGVSWHRAMGKWIVQVTHHKRNHFGGYFTDEHEAGKAAAALRAELFTHDDWGA